MLFVIYLFFALFVNHFVHNVADTISYDRKELLDIRTAITHLKLDKKKVYLTSWMRGIYSRQGPHPQHSQEKETYRGRRPGCLVRIRRRAANLPLPSLLLANVQSLDNQVDELQAPISGSLKTVISYASPSRGWTTTWITYSWRVIHCIDRIEQHPLVRQGWRSLYICKQQLVHDI